MGNLAQTEKLKNMQVIKRNLNFFSFTNLLKMHRPQSKKNRAGKSAWIRKTPSVVGSIAKTDNMTINEPTIAKILIFKYVILE